MGISSVILLVDRNFNTVAEEDLDRSLDGLGKIASCLAENHPFRMIYKAVELGCDEESLDDKIGSLLPEEARENGYTVTTPEQFENVREYLNGDINSQWDELFEQRPGFWGWLKYIFLTRSIKKDYHDYKEAAGLVPFKECYTEFLGICRKAITNDCYLIRYIY